MGINFSKVSFTYNPQKKTNKNIYTLENINLDISSNEISNIEKEFICVVGHTGSGKSTLVQLMNALLIPTEGEITISGNTITNKKQKNLKSIRKEVGVVFQFPEYQLFEETVLEDVSFGPKNYRLSNPEEKAKEALTKLKIDETFYNKSPFRLSGGEKRKVAIAGIMASEPNFLILDEPTVGLDPLAKKELIKLLKEINKQKTVIIITHDMNVVWDVATRVLLLDDNKIIYDGNKIDLFKNHNLVKNHSLDYPDIIKIMQEIKEKANMPNLNIYVQNTLEAMQEITKVTNNE